MDAEPFPIAYGALQPGKGMASGVIGQRCGDACDMSPLYPHACAKRQESGNPPQMLFPSRPIHLILACGIVRVRPKRSETFGTDDSQGLQRQDAESRRSGEEK